MNCLLVNPGHPQTFWSFERVLSLLGKKALQPPLGLITLAALLPPSWNLRLVDLNLRPLNESDWDFCQVLMVGGLVSQYSGMRDLIAQGRARGKIVVAGGPMAFHIPEELLAQGCAIVLKGEAESVANDLVRALEQGDGPRVITGLDRPDLSASPPPRYDLLDLDQYQDMALQFSRGCPFQCEFCDITLMLGRRVRTKRPEQVLAELQIIYDLGWRGPVFFVDDNFVGDPRAARALLERLVPWCRERGHPFDFYTQASVDLAQREQIMGLMVQAGFFRVFLGIETQDVDSLERAGKHQNARVDLDQVCARVTRAGLQIIAGCIIGFDHEAPGADQRLIDFAQRNHVPEMFITALQAGPGTVMWHRLEREGRLPALNLSDSMGSQSSLPNFATTRPLEQIAAEFVRSYQVLYEPAAYLERCLEHFAAMVPPPPAKRLALPKWGEVRAVLAVFRELGLRSPGRATFWSSLLGMLRRSPRRLRFFLASCVTFLHYLRFRDTVRRDIARTLADQTER